MVGIGEGVFLQVANHSDQHVLHPAKVVGTNENVHTVTLDERVYANQSATDAKSFSPGRDVRVYFEKDRRFMQQAARIECVEEGESQPVICLEMLGEPASAERRESFRVSTVTSEIVSTLGKEKECPVVDVSATGYSVFASAKYDIGATVPASMTYKGEALSGTVSVQSARELGGGHIRYGVHSLDDKKSKTSIAAKLPKIAMEVQRAQLRRLAGTS